MCKCSDSLPPERDPRLPVAPELPVVPELPKASNTEDAPKSAGVDIPIYQPPPAATEPAGLDVPLAPVGTPAGIDPDGIAKATYADDEKRKIPVQDLNPEWNAPAKVETSPLPGGNFAEDEMKKIAAIPKQDLNPEWNSDATSPTAVQDLDPFWSTPATTADAKAAAAQEVARVTAENDAAAKELEKVNAARPSVAETPVSEAAPDVTGEEAPSTAPIGAVATADPYADAPAPAATADAPEPVAVTSESAPSTPDELKASDASCRSLAPSTNDYWCATTCANDKSPSACPPEVCQCGPREEQDHEEKEEMRKAADSLPSSPGAP